MIVKAVYGSLPNMLVECGYGPGGKNLSEEASAERHEIERLQAEAEADQRERDLAILEPAAAAVAAAMHKAAQERGSESQPTGDLMMDDAHKRDRDAGLPGE